MRHLLDYLWTFKLGSHVLLACMGLAMLLTIALGIVGGQARKRD